MADEDDDTEEPQSTNVVGMVSSSPQVKKSRRSFGKLRRELTQTELEASGVQKMLLDEVERLEAAEIDLKLTSEKFHEANTKHLVAEEKLKTHNAFDIISTGTVAVGSLLFGAAFNWKNDTMLFTVCLAISAVLMIIGIVAKLVRA